MATTQNFTGTEPVDQFPHEVAEKIDDDELTRREAQRDSALEPGANKRAGVATRDPAGERASRAPTQGRLTRGVQHSTRRAAGRLVTRSL